MKDVQNSFSLIDSAGLRIAFFPSDMTIEDAVKLLDEIPMVFTAGCKLVKVTTETWHLK